MSYINLSVGILREVSREASRGREKNLRALEKL